MERGKVARQFIDSISAVSADAAVTDGKGNFIPLEQGLCRAIQSIETCQAKGHKLIFIGNGGSAAIANHQALDFWHNGKIKAISFGESSFLTCLANDYGYEQIFSKSLQGFAEAGDLLIAVSSSGKSKNILNGIAAAREKECGIITYSGFDEDNPLRKSGDLNFYIPSNSYGIVEVSHLNLIHSLLEDRMEFLRIMASEHSE